MSIFASYAKSSIYALALVVILTLATADVEAQTTETYQKYAIGGQLGAPSGISLNVETSDRLRYDVQAAWDVRDFFFLNAHAVWHTDFTIEQRRVRLFYGPGTFLGIRDSDESDVAAGISGIIGLGLPVDRFEFYVQFSPRLTLIPLTQGQLGGGVGVRYYFSL